MASPFNVVAIVSAFNEADIIEQVVADLIQQDIQVYFIDDCSTDGTRTIVEPFVGRGVLKIETRNSRGEFNWEQILERKAQLAGELNADWFIHHDADEFRESPWAGVSLRDAIRRVDVSGFNAIDFESLDFWPTHDRFMPGDDVREALPFFSERAPYDRLQVRCWKKTAAPVDLASTGGHEARFEGRTVFPLRFILRHYPIRSQAHGQRKVIDERKRRFREAERSRGWHVQYDDARPGMSFIKDPAALTRYDADAVRVALALRHRGVESLEEAVEAARGEVGRLERDLDTRTKDWTTAARDLHDRTIARDSLYLELEARTRERDTLYLEREALTRERDALYLELEGRTRDRDALYLDLESRTRERDALYVDREERTRERDALYLDHERRTKERDALFLEREAGAREQHALRIELEARAAGLARMAEQSAQVERECETLEARLDTLAAQLHASANGLRAAEGVIKDRNADLVAHQEAIARLRNTVDARDAAIQRYQHDVKDLVERIAGFERSSSWKLTAPLRAVARLFRK